MNRGERRAQLHYRLRGYRIVGANVKAGRNELDLIVRRGRTLLFVEVKERRGEAFGGPLAAVDAEKRRRIRRAAQAWLVRHPQRPEVRVGFEVVTVVGRRLERRRATIDPG